MKISVSSGKLLEKNSHLDSFENRCSLFAIYGGLIIVDKRQQKDLHHQHI